MQAAPHVRINPAAVSMHVLAQLALQRALECRLLLQRVAFQTRPFRFNACSGATRIATKWVSLMPTPLVGFNACSSATCIATSEPRFRFEATRIVEWHVLAQLALQLVKFHMS